MSKSTLPLLPTYMLMKLGIPYNILHPRIRRPSTPPKFYLRLDGSRSKSHPKRRAPSTRSAHRPNRFLRRGSRFGRRSHPRLYYRPRNQFAERKYPFLYPTGIWPSTRGILASRRKYLLLSYFRASQYDRKLQGDL